MPSTSEQRHVASEVLRRNSPIQSHEGRRACALVAEEMKQGELVHMQEIIEWIRACPKMRISVDDMEIAMRNRFHYHEEVESEQAPDTWEDEEADSTGKSQASAEEGTTADSSG